jgi:pimeloyl-ACP methyl ester carboxylesterase
MGFKLECSHFEPDIENASEIPCVVYLHGNCSSRLEALPLVDYILPMEMSLFCFDFAGCGLSEGEYVSLGWHERDDLELVINHLRKQKGVSTIGLWGRSMGAVTALMYAEKDLSIGGMVLDSPFSDLKLLVKDLAVSNTKLHSVLVSGALKFVKQSIKKRANFDLTLVKPISHVGHCYVPALFGVATDDELVSPKHHGEHLYEMYAGDKNLVHFTGGHNGVRPAFFLNSAAIFFQNTLKPAPGTLV